MRVFRWKAKPGSEDLAPHELRMVIHPGGIKLLLVLRKTSPQTLSLILDNVSEEVFTDAWRDHSGWQQTATENVGGKFFCIRFINIGNFEFIVWRVEHIADEPYDLFDHFHGTLAEMTQFYGV